MAARNGNIQMLSLDAGAGILNDSHAHIFNVEDSSERENVRVCCYRHSAFDRRTAGGNSRSSSTDVLPLFSAVCRAEEVSGILYQ